MKMKYTMVRCCEWCICGIRSHGEKVLQGHYAGEGTCEECGDDGSELYECIVID